MMDDVYVHRFKAASQKMHESTLQCTVIYYQRKLSYVFQKCTYTKSQLSINLLI